MVAFDAVGPSASGTSSSTTPLTWAHVNGGSATAILIGVTTHTGTTNAVTSVTYGGQACSLLAFIASGATNAGGIALYYLNSPPTGSNTVSVAFTGAGLTIGGSISVTASGGIGSVFTANPATVTSASVSVTNTTTGGMIVTVACEGSGGTFAGTNSVTKQWGLIGDNTSAADNAVGGTVPSTGGGASQTVGFSGASDDWGLIAVELLPPTSTPTSTPLKQPGSKLWRRLHRRIRQPAIYQSIPKISTLIDDMSVNRLPLLWPDTVGTTTYTGSNVTIKSDTLYDSAMVTNTPYDLTDSAIYINVTPYVATSSDIQFGLFAGKFATSNNSLFCGFGGSNNFHVFKTVNGTQTNLFTVTYNAVSMAWWRIRESGGTTFFDTAPDGVTWTNQFSTADTTFSFPLQAVGVSILGGDFGSDAAGTTTVFAVNTQPSSISFSGAPTASFTLTASAAGAKREAQSDSTAIAMAASATGIHHGVQADTASFTITASCIGHKSVATSDTSATAYVASATGAKRETQSKSAAIAMVASATGIHHGVQSATASVAMTASGAGIHHGVQSATASFVITASATGHKVTAASASAATAYVASESGSKRETQSASATVQLSATNTGSKREVASGSALIALSGTSAGSKRVTASDSAAVSLAASAIGHKVETHAVTASVTITASCTGHKVVTQSDPALVALTGSATGHKVETQAVTASVAFVATAAGSKRETQADTATVTITASCVGSNPGGAPSGNPIAIVTVTASCTGSKRGVASATAAVSFAESAVGHKSGAHAATAAVSLVSSATGHKSGAHVATAAVSLAASLVGHKAGLGHPSALVSLTGSNAGTKRLVAASTASLSFNLANAASTARAGSAAAILEFLLTSIKGSPVNPVLPGTNVNYPPGTVVIGPSRALAPYYDQMGVGGIVMNPIGRMVISVVPPNGHVATFDMQTWKLIQNSDGSITLNRPQLQGPDGSSPA